MRKILQIVVLAALFHSPITQAQMYKCTGADGKNSYQDAPCAFAQGDQTTMNIPLSPFERDPIAAAITVVNTGYALTRLGTLCAARSPATQAGLQKAMADWMLRHDALLSKSGLILRSKLSQQQRVDIAVQGKLSVDATINNLPSTETSTYAVMCRELPTKMFHPQMNLVARPVLVKTITNYVIQ
ncbi:MAG: DUF4124 domain-containing protein [Gallionella sp.]